MSKLRNDNIGHFRKYPDNVIFPFPVCALLVRKDLHSGKICTGGEVYNKDSHAKRREGLTFSGVTQHSIILLKLLFLNSNQELAF